MNRTEQFRLLAGFIGFLLVFGLLSSYLFNRVDNLVERFDAIEGKLTYRVEKNFGFDNLLGRSDANKLLDSMKFNESATLVKVSSPLDPSTSFFMWKSDDMIQWVTTILSEQEVFRVFMEVLKKTDRNSVVLDIGANAGWFGLYAAAKGSKTYFFDPQPTCGQYLRASILINAFHDRAIYIPNPVGINPGTLSVSYSTQCGGTFPQTELEKGSNAFHFEDEIKVNYVSIDKMFSEGPRIKIAKIDTEGAEYYVLESMVGIIEAKLIDNIVVETTPFFWPQMGLNDRTVVADLYKKIWNWGYDAKALKYQELPEHVFASADELYNWVATEKFLQVDVHFSLRV